MTNDSRAAVPAKPFWTAIAFALAYPTLLTLTYFVLLADFSSGVQQAVYGIGKCVQFGFPLIWVLLVLRARPRWPESPWKGVGVGLGFGLFVLAAMLVLYFSWLKPAALLQGLEQQVIDKVKDLGLDTVWKYAALGIFYALAHSLLEEYYWRWFVFGQLRTAAPAGVSIAVSSVGFMAHHIVLLATFFGWSSPLTYLFSFAVGLGGAIWAGIYQWSRSLVGPWLSHMLIDAAIFTIGYDLVKGSLH